MPLEILGASTKERERINALDGLTRWVRGTEGPGSDGSVARTFGPFGAGRRAGSEGPGPTGRGTGSEGRHRRSDRQNHRSLGRGPMSFGPGSDPSYPGPLRPSDRSHGRSLTSSSSVTGRTSPAASS